VGANCFDGTKGLRCCGASLKDRVLGCFGWTHDTVGHLRGHGCAGLELLSVVLRSGELVKPRWKEALKQIESSGVEL
jgi:hypothetical protein